MLGTVTRQNICQADAPRTRAASSSSVPSACIRGISSRATKGKVTKIVASTMPGTAKTILRSCASAQGPRIPCRPKSKRKIMPEMTGDTPKGRSMSVIRASLPRNWNFAMAQAAATPKTRFRGTAIPAARRVSLKAAKVMGSRSAPTYAVQPFSSACAKTLARGRRRNSERKATATRVSTAFTAKGSEVARALVSKRVRSAIVAAIATPRSGGPRSTTGGG